jgi:hypothetical protein
LHPETEERVSLGEQTEQELVMPRSLKSSQAQSVAIAEEETETASTLTSAGDSSAVDPFPAVAARDPAADGNSHLQAEEAGSPKEALLHSEALPQEEVRSQAAREEPSEEAAAAVACDEPAAPEQPNFAGTWDLVRTEGTLDQLLLDMGQSWLIRNGAKALRYGIGRVVVECQQDGNDLKFSKILCDPRNLSKSHVHVIAGQGSVRFLDDIGRLVSTSCWEGSSLRFDAKLESSGLPVTLLMYHDEAGNFVEEMISCKGTVAKYIFNRRA